MATDALRIGKGVFTSTLANIDSEIVSDKVRFLKALTLCNASIAAQKVTVTVTGTTVISEYSLAAIGEENTITIPFLDQVLYHTASPALNERIQGKVAAKVGTVNTSGTAVTWVTGDLFYAGMTGTFRIVSTDYTISSITIPTDLVLTATAGTQTGVAYTYTDANIHYYISGKDVAV
jgi:hypothetical protein